MHEAEGGDMGGVAILRCAEAEIDTDLSTLVQSLLQASFPGYPDRSYFKLPPHFRYLAVAGGTAVVAQMGVEFRIIRVGNSVMRTFGLVDVCVADNARSRGLATRLLSEVTDFACACGVDFVVLFADDDRLYAANGWVRVSNRCSWVEIDDHMTLGLAREESTGAMMVKAIGNKPWPEGGVDLLGHLF